MSEIAPVSVARPLKQRLLIAIPLALGLVVVGAAVYLFGMALGVMGTDGCPQTDPEWAAAWLVVVWPLSVLATALVPPALIALGKSWRKALVAFAIGCVLTIVIWLIWIPILDLVC